MKYRSGGHTNRWNSPCCPSHCELAGSPVHSCILVETGRRTAGFVDLFARGTGKTNLRKYLNDVVTKLPSWAINNVTALAPLNWKSSA
ncbi:MAG TPA: hypothetical protein VIS96_18095 [Terrimicrobiaceae bacterium]